MKRALDLMMTMRIPNLEYLALHSFGELKIKDFFRPQEILLGKSICDICLSEPETIKSAFDEFKRNFDKWLFPRAQGSLIEFITENDKIRRESLVATGFYPKQTVINVDMNFQGTLARAIFHNNTQSLRMILEEVLEKIDDSNYVPIMMFDMPLML